METIGWFSGIKRVAIGASGSRIENLTRDVERAVAEAPALSMSALEGTSHDVFNFLGTFTLPSEPSLDWTIADEFPWARS